MFDIGFPELLLFSLVVLLVLGPKRLPEAMRTLGYWYGRLRYSAGRLRQEFERELDAEKIGGAIASDKQLEELKEIKTSIEQTVSDIRTSADSSVTPDLRQDDNVA